MARELKAASWKRQGIGTDNGSESWPRQFRDAVAKVRARHRFIKAGRPNSNAASSASS